MKDPRIIRDNTQVGSGNALQEKLLVISNAEERKEIPWLAFSIVLIKVQITNFEFSS